MNFGSYTNLTSLFTSIGNKLRKKVSFELKTQAEYNALVQAGTVDPNVDYHIYDTDLTCAPIDDTTTALDKVWSSQHTEDVLRGSEVVDGKNIINFDNPYVSIIGSEKWVTNYGDRVRINNDVAGVGRKIGFWFDGLSENTDYVFSASADITSGVARVLISSGVGWDGGLASSEIYTQDTDIVLEFNTGYYTQITITLYCTGETSEIGDVMYIHPMVCTKSEWDESHAYELPYVELKDSKMSWADYSMTGAKNLLGYDYPSSTYEVNGVTFTKNADGTITANGRATGDNAEFTIFGSTNKIPISKFGVGLKYMLSTIAAYGDSTGPYIYINYYDSNLTYLNRADSKSWFINFPFKMGYRGTSESSKVAGATYVDFGVGIRKNSTVSNYVLYPMLRLGSDVDTKFKPYAMTNRELTVNKVDNSELTNSHKATVLTVSTSGWATDTTSQSGTTLYKKEISLSHVYVPCPEVAIGASGSTLPTKAQQTAYDLVQYATVDSSTNKLYLYASAVPSTQFYIKVTGVD